MRQTDTKKYNVHSAPAKIVWCGKHLELEVVATQMKGESQFRATYWHGADDVFNGYGWTPEHAAMELTEQIKLNAPDAVSGCKFWTDFEREDLRMIPAMIAKGWKPFTKTDRKFEHTTPEDIPYHDVKFQRGDVFAWKIREGWQTAKLMHGYFDQHKRFASLDEILNQL